MRVRAAVLAAGALVVATACSSDGEGAALDPGDGGRYAPVIEPAEFSAVIDNPWFPLVPGERWVYASTSSDGDQEITVEVAAEPHAVLGVPVVQVHDVVTAGGTTVEDTIDFYSQRSDGSVWYFGEATTTYDHGTTSTEGSWEAGVDGALPGIIMPASPVASQRGYARSSTPGTPRTWAGSSPPMGGRTCRRGTSTRSSSHATGRRSSPTSSRRSRMPKASASSRR